MEGGDARWRGGADHQDAVEALRTTWQRERGAAAGGGASFPVSFMGLLCRGRPVKRLSSIPVVSSDVLAGNKVAPATAGETHYFVVSSV
jgi:hypothetical protein